MKILFCDIESSAIEALVWGRYEINTAKVTRESELISAAWRFRGGAIDSECRKNGKRGSDKKVAKRFWKALDEADIVIGHNVTKFDRRKANTFFAKYGLGPPSSYQIVDTLKVTKANFVLSSYKLDDVCEYFGLGKKLKHPGIDMWDDCMKGDKAALEMMEKYNRHDVVLAEALYDFLLPWVNNHPNVALMTQRPNTCPNCGSDRFKSRGIGYTKTQAYRRYQCTDCRRQFRGQGTIKGMKKPGVC